MHFYNRTRSHSSPHCPFSSPCLHCSSLRSSQTLLLLSRAGPFRVEIPHTREIVCCWPLSMAHFPWSRWSLDRAIFPQMTWFYSLWRNTSHCDCFAHFLHLLDHFLSAIWLGILKLLLSDLTDPFAIFSLFMNPVRIFFTCFAFLSFYF